MNSQVFFLALSLLATTGLALASYFALVDRGILNPNSALLPAFCRMDDRSCTSLLKTKEASLFGVSNYVLGLLYYAVLLAVPLMSERWFWRFWTLFAASSVVTVGAGVVLTYALLVRLKVNCFLCFTSHVVNLLIAVLMFSMV